MNNAEYIKIDIKIIPQDIIDKYDLLSNQYDRYIHVRIEKGMYGLVQAGIIAYEALKDNIKTYVYAPTKIGQ